jgi:hypothetical protein
MLEHKAFVFDYDRFRVELSEILYRSLETRDLSALEAFINQNLKYLRDPYEGVELGAGWMELLENNDADELGDFALTKYYDPKDDIGLGYEWEPPRGFASTEAAGALAVLGKPFGPTGHLFDPGRLGSYFQTPEETKVNLRIVGSAVDAGNTDSVLLRASKMLESAANNGLGLYVTF